ncbi:metalloregulator ArsR/SmtB family transcription factor [Altererythrobacter salegens]|uniref:Metalloregulator ArsR/SmtB family transcription factor n=1 Tax=Croceibacterium salegens TaxID=1737568 RepID=A0A6I4SV68_9SPHN|nr:metalloregulator ArsR/SmtB family transcription factor [Croceibacterium salegens]MXO58676.1 metalloregulator ArsR/SmtB family transcription factor [Croceibacterium salegens]
MNLHFEPARADAIFFALGDATRRNILSRLMRGPASITELADHAAITKTAVGQHMALLQDCALAKSEKRGRVRTCRFDPAGLRTLQGWIDYHREEWTGRLGRLGEILDD